MSKLNFKALYYIFNGVSLGEFHKIIIGKHAKKAWDILVISHQGTSTMKLYKLQILTISLKIFK